MPFKVIIERMDRYNFLKKSVFISLLCFFSISIIAQNQQNTDNAAEEKLSLDPNLRFGRLANGLTYYIRHNETPKGQADFYLAQNVGSMQELDHQRGYVHFLEHLALRNTQNFPSKSGIKGFTEKEGLKTELNTGFDETIYKLLNVPTNRQNIIDSCLLILHDWTSFLLFDDEAIEEERLVAREEWRTRHTPAIRLLEQQVPVMYQKSRYGSRMPTGLIGIIENFQKNELIEFYKKWYVPDMQAVVIVGDIDVDRIEEKIKTIFGDIPKPSIASLKELYEVTDNDFPLLSIAKEKEETNTTLNVYYKHDNIPFQLKGTIVDLLDKFEKEVIYQVMNERIAVLQSKPDAPFISASVQDKDYFISKTKGAWTSTFVLKPNELENAMKALVRETMRLKQSGITGQEYERAKTKILSDYESAYNNREKTQNSYLSNKYVNHFINYDYAMGVEMEYEIVKQVASVFQAEDINGYIENIFTDHNYRNNMVIALTGPDSDDVKYPTEDELIELYINACDEIVGGQNKDIVNLKLIPQLPEPGKIISEKEDDLFGTTVYMLSNGIQVVVKQTEWKKDQILMSATSKGGTSMFKDEKDIWNNKRLNEAIRISGLGDLSATTLNRYLDLNKVTYSAGLTASSELINAEVTSVNLKTLFETIYLQFKGIHSDLDAFSAYRENLKTELETPRSKPAEIFSDTLNLLVYGNNPRANRLKIADLDKLDYNRMIDMYKERFADASDFVFIFVGDIDKQTLRPLLEQYLAILPALNRNDEADERQVAPFMDGKITRHFQIKSDVPATKIALMYTGEMNYNLKNLIITQSVNNLLEIMYDRRLRPYYGYSVSEPFIGVELYDFPLGRASIQIFTDTSPERQNEVMDILKTELTRLAEEGPIEQDMFRNYAGIRRKRDEIMQQNDYWLNIISSYYADDFDAHTEYETILENLTQEDIKSYTKNLLNQGNVIELMMSPE